MSAPDRISHSRPTKVKPVSFATYVLDTLALAILSHALIPLLLLNETTVQDTNQQGSALLQFLNGAVYALYAARFLLNTAARNTLRYIVACDLLFWLPVAVLLTFTLASVTWSGEPQVTLRRAIALIGTTGMGVYLALRYSPREFLQLLLGVGVVFAVSSIAMVMLWPEKGVMQISTVFTNEHVGRWRGVFLHKNHLASLMAVGIVVAAGVLRGRGLQLITVVFTLLLCMGVLLAAESLTALIATAVSLLAMLVLRLHAFGTHDGRKTLLAISPLLILTISVVLYQYGQSVPGVEPKLESTVVAGAGADGQTGVPPAALQVPEARVQPQSDGFRRDATATGRLYIWRQCWNAIQLQPLRGYGYGAFWRTGGPAAQVWKQSAFRIPHAHNGWLDLSLQLGIPLALLMAGWMLWLGARVLRWAYGECSEGEKTAGITMLGLWVCFNILNLAESVLFCQHEILSVLIFTVAVFATLSRGIGSAR